MSPRLERVQLASRRAGVDIGRPGGWLSPAGCRRVILPMSVDRQQVLANEPVTIPITTLVSATGFSYADGGYHPFWAAASWLVSGSRPDGEGNPLVLHYSNYQPATVADALFPEGPVPMPSNVWQLPARYTSVVWTLSLRDLRRIRRRPVIRTRNMHFGPASDVYVTKTIDQMQSIAGSVREHGYRPREFSGGIIEGFFLVDGDNFRFVLTEGQHRVGVLRAMGIDEVLVAPRLGLTGVERRTLGYWSLARGRPFRSSEATKLFDRYFEVRNRDAVLR